ncbi:MAG: Rpn family recombination-promoting nuclease/putative transposase [Holosporales bacterium]|jgi:predicted transposase/invertase (TIGR01784 family)|nr:Rpn family recombination-promoting nuclease/putative transposase [Holosporales bacterium]
MRRYLDPKNDFAFKRLFGTEQNKDLLIQFLNAVLDGVHSRVEEVELLPLSSTPEIANLRQSIVDALCRGEDGRQFIIEMQCARESSFIKRAAAYASRVYLNQRTKEGEGGYGSLSPVIFLAIVDFDLFPQKEAYISHHKITDIYTHECDIKDFSFSFIELRKFRKEIDELHSEIDRWLYFFRHAAHTEPDELRKIKEDYPGIEKAYSTMSDATYTEAELLEYERYAMKEDVIATAISDARREGRAEGMEEGRAEGMEEGIEVGKRETAKNLLAMGLTVEQVAKGTGLSMEEVEEIS